MAAIERSRPVPEAIVAAEPADHAYEYDAPPPTVYSGQPSGVAPHWQGVARADPAVRWTDLAFAARAIVIAACGRYPEATARGQMQKRSKTLAARWQAWILEAYDRADAEQRLVAFRAVADAGYEAADILDAVTEAYDATELDVSPRRRRRRW